jgi:hypothetical protein
MSKRLIMVLICHRHKLLDPIYRRALLAACFTLGFLHDLLFNRKDGDDMFLRNVC